MTHLALWLAKYQLSSRRPAVRLRALRRLRAAVNDAVVSLDTLITIKLLDHALADSEHEIRQEATAALGDLRDSRALPPLLRALDDGVEKVQETAIQSLKRIDDTEATEALVAKLFNGTFTIRWRAAQTLESLGWQPKTNAEKIHFSIATGKIERLAQFGDEAVKPVAAILEDAANEKRAAAVNVLGEIGGPAAFKPLLTALRDADPLVRTAGAYALGKLGSVAAVPSLAAVLKDRERTVRLAATIALGQLGDTQCVPSLIQLLEDRDWELRSAALDSLGQLGDRRAFAPVAESLEDAEERVRESAADALGHVGDQTIVDKLVLTLVDAHTGVRLAAARALTRIDPHWETSESAQRVLPSIQAALRNRDAAIQTAAAGVLRRISGTGQSEIGKAAGRSDAEQLQRVTRNLLHSLARESDPLLRLTASEAIGRLRLADCADALQQLRDDPDPGVRRAAQESLAQLNFGEPAGKVTFLSAAPPPSNETGRPELEDVLLCSSFGALHEWRCRDGAGWLKLYHYISEQAQPLARLKALGEFKRLEIQLGDGRVILAVLLEGGVMLRVRGVAVETAASPGAAAAAFVAPGESVKDRVRNWLRIVPAVRGVFMRGVRFADQTIVCDVDSRDATATTLELVYRTAAEAFRRCQALQMWPTRMLWICERAALHCARHADGTILGTFATVKAGDCDTAELNRQLAEFCALPAAEK